MKLTFLLYRGASRKGTGHFLAPPIMPVTALSGNKRILRSEYLEYETVLRDLLQQRNSLTIGERISVDGRLLVMTGG